MLGYKLTAFFLRKLIDYLTELLSLLFEFELVKAAYDWVTDYRDITSLKRRTAKGCSGQPFNRDKDDFSNDVPPRPAVRREVVTESVAQQTAREDLNQSISIGHPTQRVRPRGPELSPADRERVEQAVREQRKRIGRLDLNGPMPDGLSRGEDA